VMLYSRVVAPEMFPAVLGACFADASKLRLQQVIDEFRVTYEMFSAYWHAAFGSFCLSRLAWTRRTVSRSPLCLVLHAFL
jgi:hypothetical protein